MIFAWRRTCGTGRAARARCSTSPQSGSALDQYLAQPAARLVIHHGYGQEPLLQAEELRMWLMALAIDGARVSLINDVRPQEPLKIEVHPNEPKIRFLIRPRAAACQVGSQGRAAGGRARRRRADGLRPERRGQSERGAAADRHGGRAGRAAWSRCPNISRSWACKDTDKVARPREGRRRARSSSFSSDTAQRHKIWLSAARCRWSRSDPARVRNSLPGVRRQRQAGRALRQDPSVRLRPGRRRRYSEERTIEPGKRGQGRSIRRSAASGCRSATTCAFPSCTAR